MCRVLWDWLLSLVSASESSALPSDLLPAFSASMFLGASQIPLTLYTGKEAAPSL